MSKKKIKIRYIIFVLIIIGIVVFVGKITKLDDLNAEKPAENTDNSTKNINMESIRCDNNSAVFQQNEQKSNFDIVDFIISHSDGRSVRKKSKLPRILLCVILGVLIIGICVLSAIWSVSSKQNRLFGTWSASGGVTMTINDKNITINGKTSEYIIEEKNVIAIKMNNEYYKIIYKLDGDSLTLTIPDESGVSELKYTRKSD